jgi:hypothetical protein
MKISLPVNEWFERCVTQEIVSRLVPEFHKDINNTLNNFRASVLKVHWDFHVRAKQAQKGKVFAFWEEIPTHELWTS